MIHLYTGDGKGKTTAAVGLAVRALGQSWQVALIQFLKGGESGELAGLRRLGASVARLSRPFGFWQNLPAAERDALKAEHDRLIGLALGLLPTASAQTLVVLDELTYVVRHRLADEALIGRLVAAVRTTRAEVVITGRDAGRLADLADYVSDIAAVRHPFDLGASARRGVEF
ncbi:MAG: cob(I)yrinic acid a,c-diamide adenosyltransferase [Kiritimatiellia bacterium]